MTESNPSSDTEFRSFAEFYPFYLLPIPYVAAYILLALYWFLLFLPFPCLQVTFSGY
jgi:hypothetical protein